MFSNRLKVYIVFFILSIITISLSSTSLAHHPIRTINLDYKITFDKSEKLGNSDRVDLWIPIARADNVQEINKFTVQGIEDYKITEDSVWGNRMIHFSTTKAELPDEIIISYGATRKEYSSNKENYINSELFLQPSTNAVHSDRVKRISNKLASGNNNNEEVARIKYDFILENMNYNKEATKHGDVEGLCMLIEGGDDGSGNCTDYHSIFTSLLQTQNIPARLFMGIPLKADGGSLNSGYHCWAEFLSDDGTWYPVDISEADKNPSKKDFYFKSLDHNRFSFSMGRDIVLNPAQSGDPLNFFGPYPYGESNGVPFKGFTTTISYN